MKDSLKKLYNQHRSLNQTTLSSETKQALKARILSKINNPQEEPKFQFSWSALFLKSYVIAPLALVLFISGATFTSAKSVPGDFLYPVKRAVEDVRLYVTTNDESKSNLEVLFAKERLEELERLNDQSSQRNNSKDDSADSTDDSNDDSRNRDDDNSDDRSGHDSNDDNSDDEFNEHRDQAQRNAEDAIKTLKDQRKEIEDRIEKFESDFSSNSGDDHDDDADNNNDESSSGGDDNNSNEDTEDTEDSDDNSGHGSDSSRDDSDESTSEN